MFESEDGYLTGSIDMSKLDELKPKSDEAKAQIAALIAERDAGQKQADAAAERAAEQSATQDDQLHGKPAKDEAPKVDASKAAASKPTSSTSPPSSKG